MVVSLPHSWLNIFQGRHAVELDFYCNAALPVTASKLLRGFLELCAHIWGTLAGIPTQHRHPQHSQPERSAQRRQAGRLQLFPLTYGVKAAIQKSKTGLISPFCHSLKHTFRYLGLDVNGPARSFLSTRPRVSVPLLMFSLGSSIAENLSQRAQFLSTALSME